MAMSFEFQSVSYSVAAEKKTKKAQEGSDESSSASSSSCGGSLRPKAKTKLILSDISGSVSPGSVLGILGPSGAGKTTLLRVLTLSALGGTASGEVLLGGEAMTQSLFREHCIVVEQFSRNWEHLTARDAVRYAADLFLPTLSHEERRGRVDAMLEKMGLTSCADTKCGGNLFAGLSGGQMKRLSLAVALIKKPSLIFLDEPTSGLDAASATAIMKFVKDLAVAENLAIVVTIHQPSQRVYEMLSSVMLLSKGRVAYYGPADKATDYFEAVGEHLPERMSIAEFMLDLVNSEFTSTEKVVALLDIWEASPKSEDATEQMAAELKRSVSVIVPSENPTMSTAMRQVGILVRRHLKLLARDPLVYTGRAGMFLFVCTFFGVVYIGSRRREQEQVLNKLFFNMWVIGVPACFGAVTVFSYTAEFAAIASEVRNGMLFTSSYFLSNLIIQVPAMFVLSICALLPGYVFVDWNWSNFGEMLLEYGMCLLAFEGMAQLIAAVMDEALLGMLAYMMFWFTCFLFAGILVPTGDIVWPLRVFCYCFPLRWQFRAMAYLEYSEDFSGAEFCPTAGLQDCFYHYDDNGAVILPGFTCVNQGQSEEASEFVCYGKTGAQVVDSLGVHYSTLSSKNTIFVDFIVNFGIYVFCKIVMFIALARRCKQHTTILPPFANKEI